MEGFACGILDFFFFFLVGWGGGGVGGGDLGSVAVYLFSSF